MCDPITTRCHAIIKRSSVKRDSTVFTFITARVIPVSISLIFFSLRQINLVPSFLFIMTLICQSYSTYQINQHCYSFGCFFIFEQQIGIPYFVENTVVFKAACKRTQQLPTLLRQQCWELLRPCWQWCANGCNNSQQCWDLQCIVGRIQPISLCKPCVMSVRGPNNVGRAVQTDPTLLRYASAITEQKKCWELLAEKFDTGFKLCVTTRNNIQQHATGCANGRNM